MITGAAKCAGVMGWPVSHSRSPRLHNYWLNQYGIDGAYVPLAVPPEKLADALRALPALGFRGVNLTLPHKEAALALLDHVDPLAGRIGAVNTVIVRDDGSLEGRNSDVFGFAENLKAAGFSQNSLPFESEVGWGDVQPDRTAVILGAGGAARAVLVALQQLGFTRLHIVNRTLARADRLAAAFTVPGLAITTATEAVSLADADLLVNTTALGMAGQPQLDLDLSTLQRSAWVTDIVYAPLETDLLRRARAAGNRTIDGLGMLLHQARPGFHVWFGHDPEVTAGLRAAVLSE